MPLGIVTRLAQDSAPDGYPANAPTWQDLSDTNIIKINGTSLTGAEFWSQLVLAAGNTFTKYSRSQYALLLPMESADDMAVVERRLSAAYESARTQAAAFLEFRGTVLEELYG